MKKTRNQPQSITTEADKADFFRRIGSYYDNLASKEVKPSEREKLESRAERARTHAATYTTPPDGPDRNPL